MVYSLTHTVLWGVTGVWGWSLNVLTALPFFLLYCVCCYGEGLLSSSVAYGHWIGFLSESSQQPPQSFPLIASYPSWAERQILQLVQLEYKSQSLQMSVGAFLGPVEVHTVALTHGYFGRYFDLEVIEMYQVCVCVCVMGTLRSCYWRLASR